MLLTALHSGPVSLHLTVPAAKVLFLRLLLHIKLTLAVDHAAEVRLLAIVALIEGAGVHGQGKEIALVEVAWASEPLIRGKILVLGNLKCKFVDLLTQLSEIVEFLGDFGAPDLLNFALAAGAGHESEGDLQRAPSVLQELMDAVGVEDVTAAELDASFSLEFARVAD